MHVIYLFYIHVGEKEKEWGNVKKEVVIKKGEKLLLRKLIEKINIKKEMK